MSSVQTTSRVSDGVDVRVLVVEWKFAELDANNDRVVDAREIERLGRLVKKLVKPTSCATSFHTRCDVDFDSSLTLQEWQTCFDDDAHTNHSSVNGSLHAGFGNRHTLSTSCTAAVGLSRVQQIISLPKIK